MENILLSFALIIGVIVAASIINEKKIRMPQDIALLIFATLVSIILLICSKVGIFPEISCRRYASRVRPERWTCLSSKDASF